MSALPDHNYLKFMGLLTDYGEVYSYEESIKHQQQVKKMAALQFLERMEKFGKWNNPTKCCFIRWGDEVEGHRLKKDPTKGYELMEAPLPQGKSTFPLMLEYGRWMFEMIPKEPHFTHCNLFEVIRNMRARYEECKNLEGIYLTIPAVPFLGLTAKREAEEGHFKNDITKSLFFSDTHISDHPRFRSLTKNIRERRGRKVEILVPLFPDEKTDLKGTSAEEPFAGKIYMDAMGFGMGMSCLQCTFGTRNLQQATYIHDMMHVLSPLFLSLTAATPILKGKLANWDARWKIIEDSVDDRTPEELDPASTKYQAKSRYSPMNHYIWNSPKNRPEYNDERVCVNEEVMEFLKKEAIKKEVAIDEKMLNHIGALTSRDFIVMHEKFTQIKEDDNCLFEMINSTNWNSVRFKMPLNETMGWRVEFRSMEIQLTADENSAFSLLVFCLVKMLAETPSLNFYIPITKVNENFDRAHHECSILKEKFFFRTNVFDEGVPKIAELYLREIFFGSKDHEFPGLFTLIRGMLEDPNTNCPKKKENLAQILGVLESIQGFIKDKMEGKRLTLAQWMRQFVHQHKQYNKDSIVSQQIMTDLLDTLVRIGRGEQEEANFSRIFS